MNTTEWDAPLAGFGDVLEDQLLGLQKRVAMYMFSLIIQRSPIDTGAFRGNHRISVGAIDTESDPSLRSTGRTGEVDPTLIANAATVLETLVPYTTVYIQNNLPYAVPLEEGHSKQAPLGVYALAVNDASEEFR